MKRYFVTGTDTGVGKTTVSAALLAAASRRGLRAAAFKPAESGCASGPSGLLPADAVRLRGAAGAWQSLEQVCAYRFAAAVAPGVAAEAEGISIDVDAIVAAASQTTCDLALMEGAGGWLVPLGGGVLISDLAVAYGAPVLVVARCGLGTINHTLLSIESIRRCGLRVAGVVLSDAEDTSEPAATKQNAAEIRRASGVDMLGVLPHLRSDDVDSLAVAAAAHLDLERLL